MTFPDLEATAMVQCRYTLFERDPVRVLLVIVLCHETKPDAGRSTILRGHAVTEQSHLRACYNVVAVTIVVRTVAAKDRCKHGLVDREPV